MIDITHSRGYVIGHSIYNNLPSMKQSETLSKLLVTKVFSSIQDMDYSF